MSSLSKTRSSSTARHLSTSLFSSDGTRLLSDIAKYGGQPFVMAGAVRDAFAVQYSDWPTRLPRDVDIGIAGLRPELFSEILTTYCGKRNRYGGYRVELPLMPHWDVWRLEDTVGLRRTKVAISVENVLRSFVLNCNAAAYDILNDYFLDLNAGAAINRRELSLIPGAILHDEGLFAAKAWVAQHRFHLRPTYILERFVALHLTRVTLIHEVLKCVNDVDIELINTRITLEAPRSYGTCGLNNENRRFSGVSESLLDFFRSLLA